MKIKTELLIYECEDREDCDITKSLNEILDGLNITDDNLIDIKFQTHEREITPDMPGAEVDGFIYKVAVLIIYKEGE